MRSLSKRLVKFIRYMLWSWVPFLLSRNFGLEGDEAGYLSTLFDLFGIVGVIACGWCSDRLASGKRIGVSLLFLLGMRAAPTAYAGRRVWRP